MAAVSLAIIGKNNEPLYMKEFFFDSSSNNDNKDATMIPEEELFGITKTHHEHETDTAKKETTTTTTTTQSSSHPAIRDCSLRQQFLLHAALDRFEELSGPPPGFAWRRRSNHHHAMNPNAITHHMTAADAMFVGLLCPQEEFRVYGYMSTTRVKFMLTIREDVVLANNNNNNISSPDGASTTEDDEHLESIVKGLMVEIHRIYVEYALNPFSAFLSGPIVSQRFDKQVLERVKAYNRKYIVPASTY